MYYYARKNSRRRCCTLCCFFFLFLCFSAFLFNKRQSPQGEKKKEGINKLIIWRRKPNIPQSVHSSFFHFSLSLSLTLARSPFYEEEVFANDVVIFLILFIIKNMRKWKIFCAEYIFFFCELLIARDITITIFNELINVYFFLHKQSIFCSNPIILIIINEKRRERESEKKKTQCMACLVKRILASYSLTYSYMFFAHAF